MDYQWLHTHTHTALTHMSLCVRACVRVRARARVCGVCLLCVRACMCLLVHVCTSACMFGSLPLHPASRTKAAAQHIEPIHLHPGSSSTAWVICTILFQFIMCILSECVLFGGSIQWLLYSSPANMVLAMYKVTSPNFNPRRKVPVLTA